MNNPFIRVCKCEKCNNIINVDNNVVLTSIPPKYYYYCRYCNNSGYVEQTNTFVQEVKSEPTKTIVINLFGGPGIGKSTIATYLFSKLKTLNFSIEYVPEFAKEKVWENSYESLKNQFYITGMQSWMISRCIGKVDLIITDSPILLGCIYNKDNLELNPAIVYEFNKYTNINVLINRENKSYDGLGRVHNLQQSLDIDSEIKKLLKDYEYVEFRNDMDYNYLVEIILNEIAKL